MELLPEIIAAGLLGLVGWFCKRVLNSLDIIKDDLHEVANHHGERLARLETEVNHRRFSDVERLAS